VSPADRSDATGADRDATLVTGDEMSERPDVASADGSDVQARLARSRRMSTLLDSAFTIPRTQITVGLDPILGVVPVVGDIVPTAASAYIVAQAAALGAPRATLLRMCLNLFLDAAVGSIPFVGDAFDVVWRANDRNIRLLESRLADPTGEERDRRAVAVVGAVVFLLVLAVGIAGVAAAWWLLGVAGAV
jgi:hypothetical protein